METATWLLFSSHMVELKFWREPDCCSLHVRHDHVYLLSYWKSLPFMSYATPGFTDDLLLLPKPFKHDNKYQVLLKSAHRCILAKNSFFFCFKTSRKTDIEKLWCPLTVASSPGAPIFSRYVRKEGEPGKRNQVNDVINNERGWKKLWGFKWA